jgi:hypothetical protein
MDRQYVTSMYMEDVVIICDITLCHPENLNLAGLFQTNTDALLSAISSSYPTALICTVTLLTDQIL